MWIPVENHWPKSTQSGTTPVRSSSFLTQYLRLYFIDVFKSGFLVCAGSVSNSATGLNSSFPLVNCKAFWKPELQIIKTNQVYRSFFPLQ